MSKNRPLRKNRPSRPVRTRSRRLKIPVRTCAGCGEKRPKSAMIRVGAGAEGEPGITAAGKWPGRGAYLCPETACLRAASNSGGLARALRTKVPDGLFAELEREIERRQKVQIG